MKIKGNDYEIIEANKAEIYSEKFGYWCVKSEEGLILGEKDAGEADILGTIEENGNEFGILLCHFQNSKQDKKSIKRCVLIFDESALKRMKKSTSPSENNQRVSNPFNSFGQILSMQEKIKNNVAQDYQTQFNFQNQLLQMQNAMLSEQQKNEFLRLEQKLETDYQNKKRDLESEFNKKELEFVKREMQLDNREAKLEELEEDLKDREQELKEEKEKFEKLKEEYREKNKGMSEGVTEGVLSGLGGALMNTFAGLIPTNQAQPQNLNGNGNKNQEDDFFKDVKTEKKPKSKYSFVNEVTVEEGKENE